MNATTRLRAWSRDHRRLFSESDLANDLEEVLDKLDAIEALCVRHNRPACVTNARVLAGKILEVIGGDE